MKKKLTKCERIVILYTTGVDTQTEIIQLLNATHPDRQAPISQS